jgi:FAD/FMN-containing dehydrogenase
MSSLKARIQSVLKGDVYDDARTLKQMSRDTSLFEKKPYLVVAPKDAGDLCALVKEVRKAKKEGLDASVTGRAAGTDMSGGPLSTSIVAVFTKYMNKVLEVSDGYALTEPGVYYRDFEKKTLEKNLILPSYPASRSIAGMGGIVANNSGGERTLKYGKTAKYVEELEVVLSDGTKTTFKALTQRELAEKQKLQGLEGDIYRNMSALLAKNASRIEKARPSVSKNSAGYALWDIIDTKTGTFNLAKLIAGSQGTLALWTKAKLSLVRPEEYRSMLVVLLSDFEKLPDVVHRVMTFNPESFESYDDHTFELALRFLPQMLSQMGFAKAVRLGLSFLPEIGLVVRGGVPKLLLMAEFSESTQEAALKKAEEAREALQDLNLPTRIAKDSQAAEKYWIVRRESFALLQKNLHGYYASPFIDDFVVPIDSYPEFLPRLYKLIDSYKMINTIAGHIGNGNFHIIPLMDLKDPNTKKTILELAPKVYDLVIQYGGTTTGEHNDGIIRTPYLTQLFGQEIVRLFEETKRIFDPENIFNPGKKVGGTFADIEKYLLRSS